MTGTPALDHLARLAGIEDGWWDFFGEWRVVPPETKRVFLAAMGLPAGDDDEARVSLRDLLARPWRRWLEPVLVVEEHTPPPSISITLPHAADHREFGWTLEEELGIVHRGRFRPSELRWGEEHELEGRLIHRRWLDLPALPPIGYHRFVLTDSEGHSARMTLIVTPARAFVPEIVADGPGAWGIATQVYALRSAGDWGVGSYAGLADLAAGAARLGAACVGVNPLHALFPSHPDRFSPYSPSSRRFLNTAYIDVETIPEFAECQEARRMFASPGFQASLARVRGYRLIEYRDVAQLARPMLEALYRWFRKTHLEPETERGLSFRAFQAAGGEQARAFAVFEALHERFEQEGNGYWRQWPDGLRRPDSPEVIAFAEKNLERVEFFHWLQFIADQQLGAAHGAGKDAGAAMGLYRDLAVGIAGDGAEAWAEQDALALGVSVGAPPDPLALKGQDW
ncbi:MAG: 4-alpha-glucanotransferase, partial [Magnetospirillum sp.]